MCWEISKDKHFKVLNFKISYEAIIFSYSVLIIFLLCFRAGFKKILGFKLVGFHNMRKKYMLGFRSEATRFERFFKKKSVWVTRFGIIVLVFKLDKIFIFFQNQTEITPGEKVLLKTVELKILWGNWNFDEKCACEKRDESNVILTKSIMSKNTVKVLCSVILTKSVEIYPKCH